MLVYRQLLLVVTLVGAGYIKAFEDTVEKTAALGQTGVAEQIYSFSSTESIVAILLSFTALMLVLMMVVLVQMVNKRGYVSTIRHRETGKEPILTLGVGQAYHLFNSHIWSTGQDATATIKRQLQRLMPSVRVFLE